MTSPSRHSPLFFRLSFRLQLSICVLALSIFLVATQVDCLCCREEFSVVLHFTMAATANDFVPLATLQLPAASRLLPSACCPDKDLVVVISRLGGKDRMSLWKMQGSKKWEVDVDTGAAYDEEVVDLAWSPDGACSRFLCYIEALSCISATRPDYRTRTSSSSHHFPFYPRWPSRARRTCASWLT